MAVAANTLDLGGASGQSGAEVQARAIPVAAGAAFVRILVAQIVGRRGRLGIRGKNVGANPLTSFRILRTMRRGGMADDNFTVLATDAELAALSGTFEIQNVMPAAPHTLAAGASFDLILNAAGVAEYALEVKSALGTTMELDLVVD